jgi:hypothetical protein
MTDQDRINDFIADTSTLTEHQLFKIARCDHRQTSLAHERAKRARQLDERARRQLIREKRA